VQIGLHSLVLHRFLSYLPRMNSISRAIRAAVSCMALAALPLSAQAQDAASAVAAPAAEAPAAAPLAPQYARPDDPWIYRGTDIPVDPEWLMGEMPNGLRYAVRHNGVPPGQVSLRVAIDAGSLHETEEELGFAHLVEHLTFRESRYFKDGEAIPHFQRWGASLGNDTNATTSPTQTVYKLDLPNAGARLEESVRLFAGMIQEPALSAANLAADVPIVLAERRDQAGSGRRIAEATRGLFFAGQRLATRGPIGTVETLQNATPEAVQAFHKRWYRPENAVVVMVGDADPQAMAALIERYFGDWEVPGERAPEPDFGTPQPPEDAPADNPVGETRVLVEPGQPRGLTYAILRPYEQVLDNLEYNRGLLIDSVALSIINRRLESLARSGGSFLYAGVEQEDVSRSSDATYVAFAPLTDDWETALAEVRSVIADALVQPPTQAEIDQALSQFDVAFVDMVEQRRIQAGSRLADDLVNAVDIREAVAAPETFLSVFRGMRDRFTPETILEHTQRLFQGDVIRAMLLTPEPGEADEAELRNAMLASVEANGDKRDDGLAIAFADLPPIGTPTQPLSTELLGIKDVLKLTWENGVRALVSRSTNEPGRVTVRVRFGNGFQGFADDEGVYADLGQMALVNSGIGPLDQDDLDRLAAGRKLSFGFTIEEGTFQFEGLTRAEDVADQLYLFAAKLANPRWDEAPVERAKASAVLAYDSYGGNPSGVINRDLDWLLHDRDPRFATPDPESLRAATAGGFREVWSRMLSQGPVEVSVFGDIDTQATIEALNRTFGALPPRQPAPSEIASRELDFPASNATPSVLPHGGEVDQAAAVMAWPTGGGTQDLREARKLEVLAQVFGNRLLERMRERAGAAYSPYVASNWPRDVAEGGTILALAQVQPEHVSGFFAEAETIAQELAAEGPTPDELERVLEPMRQLLNRAQTGHTFWLNQLQGAAFDPLRVAATRPNVLWGDYLDTSAEELRELAQRYLLGHGGYKLAVLPSELASNAEELFAREPKLAGR
jgi:zinc protease